MTQTKTKVLTLREAAAYLPVSEAAVLAAVQSQKLPARQLGNEWRFFKAALHCWLSQTSQKRGILAHVGAFKAIDPELEKMLKEIHNRRGRPEACGQQRW